MSNQSIVYAPPYNSHDNIGFSARSSLSLQTRLDISSHILPKRNDSVETKISKEGLYMPQ